MRSGNSRIIGRFFRDPRLTLIQNAPSFILLFFIALLLIAKYELLFHLNINWDEFRFLSDIYKYQRNELSAPLQTFHVHFFTWLTTIDGTEIEQIYAGRLAMFFLQLGSCWLLFLIARNFYGVTPSLFVVFSYLSFFYVILHGTSFRFDPIITFLLLLSLLLLLLGRNLYIVLLSGCAFALALIITIKSAIFLPILLLSMIVPDFHGIFSSASFKRTFWFLVSLTLAFAILYFSHKASLATPPDWNSGSYASGSFEKMFLSEGYFPRLGYFSRSLMQDRVLWIIMFISLCLIIPFRKKDIDRKSISLLVFVASLIPIVFYRNAFSYFYVIMLAPASILMGSFLSNRYSSIFSKNRGITRLSVAVLPILLVAFIAFWDGSIVRNNYFDQVAPQKELLELVHRLFPDPVPYIDRCSVIPSFSKVGFFMSTWGMDSYLSNNRPIMNNLVRKQSPVILVANATPLYIFLDYKVFDKLKNYRLLKEDWDVLKQNYIHHWGLLYVAGKQFQLKEKNETTFEILVPGLYTVESSSSVILDGKSLSPGTVIDLKAGSHTIEGERNDTTTTLRWGDNLYRPDIPPSIESFFTRL